jgi:hypothetical protein
MQVSTPLQQQLTSERRVMRITDSLGDSGMLSA